MMKPALDQRPFSPSHLTAATNRLRDFAQLNLAVCAAALTLILTVALALRLWGMRFGFPFLYHYDELFYVATALKLGTGVLHNKPFAPVGFSNILAIEYGFFYVWARLTGLVESAQAFEGLYRSEPATFYLFGRVTSAVFGSLTALVVYGIGQTLANRMTGLLAATFLAVSFLHMRDSHYSTPDVTMAFFIALAVWLTLLGVRQQQTRLIYLAALTAGAAVSLKWTAAPVGLPVYLGAVGLDWLKNGLRWRALYGKTAVAAIAFTALGFALTSPQILLNPTPYLNEALGQLGAGSEGGFEIWLVDSVSGWQFYLKQLLINFGLLLFVTAVAGVGYQIWRLRQPDWLITLIALSFPVTYYLLMGSTRHYFARYAMPLIPFAAVFAAAFIVFLLRHLTKRTTLGRAIWVFGCVTFLLILQPFANSARHNILISREDTRTTAYRWIEQNLPEGSRIVTDWDTHGPPLSTLENPQPTANRHYDYTFIRGIGLPANSLDWYRQEGYDYLIVSSFISQIPSVRPEIQSARQAFYAELSRQLTLVQQFTPAAQEQPLPFVFDEIYGPIVSLWQRQQPGPTITIYRLDP